MLTSRLGLLGDAPLVVGLSAHPDDLEIGCGGTLLQLAAEHAGLCVVSVVLTGDGVRASESRSAHAAFTGGRGEVHVLGLRDGFLPGQWSQAKQRLREVTAGLRPDLVLAPSRSDAHQDHRVVSELAWQIFRDTLVLEYEIPKWEADRVPTNAYVALSPAVVDRKLALLAEHFPSQGHLPWYDEEVFRGLLRLRGVECGSRYAEGFHVQKLLLAP